MTLDGRFRWVSEALIVTLILVSAARAGNGSTTWGGGVDDWSSANWSAGEPTSSDTAKVAGGTLSGTQSGELCQALLIGLPGGFSPTVITEHNSSLTVGGLIHVGYLEEGSLSQLGGTISGVELRMGSAS